MRNDSVIHKCFVIERVYPTIDERVFRELQRPK